MCENLRIAPMDEVLNSRRLLSKVALTLGVIARLAICPGDEILAVTAPVAIGVYSSDSPQAVLPSPIDIENKKDKNQRFIS